MTTLKNKIAIGYCRVSTSTQFQEGLSLDVQEEACRMAIKNDGCKLLKIIRDEGKSAGSLKRSGIQEIIGLVENKKVDIVYTISSDRLNRNTGDYIWLIDLFKKNNIQLRYIHQANLDDSAASQTMGTIMAAFNEMQRLQTSEKVKRVITAKVDAGYYPERAPVGYLNALNQDPSVDRLAKRIIVPDSVMAPLVTEAFKLFSTGNYNGYELNELLAGKGLRTRNGLIMSPSRFYGMLQNRTYVGEVRWGRITNPLGKHQPLIDKDTFDQVQSVLAGHNKHAGRSRKYSWLLSGFIYCAKHGRRYTAEWHLNKKIAYYHCTNRSGCGHYIESNKLENMIAKKFQDLEFNPDFVSRVIEKAKAMFYKRRQEYEAKRQSLVNQKTAFEAKLKSAEDKLFTNTLTDDDFKRIRYEIKSELEGIDGRLFELESKQEIRIDVVQEVLAFTTNLYQTYQQAPPHLKRHYLSLFWDRFEVADGVIIKSCSSLLFTELLKLEQIYCKNQNPQNTGDLLVSKPVITKLTWLSG